jgi:hypothetical protein
MSLNIVPWKSWLPLSSLFVVVLAWLQIGAAIGRAGEGFFNSLLMANEPSSVGSEQRHKNRNADVRRELPLFCRGAL